MATFMIGYDLHKGEDYSSLIEAIKSYSLWWHHLDSTWIIQTDDSAVAIRDYLKQFIRSDDQILVAKIGAPAAWFGFAERGSKWLIERL